jgi:hypothetical protein
MAVDQFKIIALAKRALAWEICCLLQSMRKRTLARGLYCRVDAKSKLF